VGFPASYEILKPPAGPPKLAATGNQVAGILSDIDAQRVRLMQVVRNSFVIKIWGGNSFI
jgi:hypothetical protein